MQSTPEQWLPIPGYEGFYEVSNRGSVQSVDRVIVRDNGRIYRSQGRLVKQKTTTGGYQTVCLSKHGNKRTERVHRLVLLAFVGPCPDGMQACHRNDIPTDNRLVNLRWDSDSANKHDQVRNGNHRNARKTHCPQGHKYTPDNTYVFSSGRVCKACARARARDSYARVT